MRSKHSALSRGEGREGLKDVVVLLSAEAGAANGVVTGVRWAIYVVSKVYQASRMGDENLSYWGRLGAVGGSMCVKLFFGEYRAEAVNAGSFVPL
jgi:hypothetical protein